jgi:hypothetical protein
MRRIRGSSQALSTLAQVILCRVRRTGKDQWFEGEVKPRLRGQATLVRFADDFVMTFETYHDAKRVMGVLGKRLARFGLTLHPDKTLHRLPTAAPWGDASRLQGRIVRLSRL